MGWLKNVFLSPRIVAIVGCLSLLFFLIVARDSILEPMFYGISYASGQAQAGLWTEAQAQDFIVNMIARQLPDLILPIILIF